MKGCILYGGSFNPVHIGHLRLALEVAWHLEALADRLEFVPASRHPQKNDGQLLPLFLRMEMIRASIDGQRNMRCSGVEGERETVSYTFDTLKEYLEQWKPNELYFLLGSQDYALIDSWHKWHELASLCNLLVVPRGVFSGADFETLTRKYWATGKKNGIPERMWKRCPQSRCLPISDSTFAFFLPVPWLPISSSWIRALWLEKRNPLWLMPPAALAILNRERKLVEACWIKGA